MKFLLWLLSFFPKPMPPVTPEPTPEPEPVTSSTKDTLYAVSKSLIGKHLTLNQLVDQRLGCAQALSYVLKQVKWTSIPKHGIDGTAGLLEWFEGHPEMYEEIFEYQQGAIALAVTGTGNSKIRGHTAVCGYNCMMSNNSQSGLWDTHWDWERWYQYYDVFGGFKTRFFILK